MFNIKAIRGIESVKSFAGKRVVLRAELNAPVDAEGNVQDAMRIRESVPTIQMLLKKKATQVVILAHFKRPEGKVVESMRLAAVAAVLAKLLGSTFAERTQYEGFDAYRLGKNVILLENVRFFPEEESKSAAERKKLAKRLAALGDVYVNDAFGTVHRAHASVVELSAALPHYAGLLMHKELENLSQALYANAPVVSVIGGAKISTKIGLLESLANRSDALLVGGALANTFLAAQGFVIGKSLVEQDKIPVAKKLLAKYPNIDIPSDVVVSTSLEKAQKVRIASVDAVGLDEYIVDIGPATAARYASAITAAQSMIWNGSLGLIEVSPFAAGTEVIAHAAALTDAKTYAGGGETVESIENLKLAKKFTWVSTGGGAMLEFLEKEGKLPGVVALE